MQQNKEEDVKEKRQQLKRMVKELCRLAKEVYGEQIFLGWEKCTQLIECGTGKILTDGLKKKLTDEEYETLDGCYQIHYAPTYNQDKNWDDYLHNLICKEAGEPESF